VIYAKNEPILIKHLVEYQGVIRATDESEVSLEYFMSKIDKDPLSAAIRFPRYHDRVA
jgi:hypothetical protein